MDSARDYTMLTTILIFLLVSKTTLAQLNGEFWWLNDKVTKLKGIEPPQPKFEELSEFDTDESAKIIFRDNMLPSENKFDDTNTISDNINENIETNVNTNDIVFPDESFRKPFISLNTEKFNFGNEDKRTGKKIKNGLKPNNGDVFIFKYPDDDNIIIKYPVKSELQKEFQNNISEDVTTKPMPREDKLELDNTTEKTANENHKIHDEFTFKFPDDNLLSKNVSEMPEVSVQNNESVIMLIDNTNEVITPSYEDTTLTDSKEISLSENICSFMKKNDCYRRNGVVYTTEKTRLNNNLNTNLICCVVPLPTVDSNRIVFPDSSAMQLKRLRRSNNEESNRSLRQRDFLLKQKFRPQILKPTTQTKIATPDDDDYVDPYLNIKGSSIKQSNTRGSIKQDCNNYPDYIEDYVVELPKPGLVGLYSDNGQGPWSFQSDNNRPSYGGDGINIGESEEDEEPSFGYATLDPRRGTSKPPPIRGRPSKLTTSLPDEGIYDGESQTVSFQSTPNFQVLQGFKLLNLGRNKNKFYSKGNRRSTTEGTVESDVTDLEDNNSGLLKWNDQVYENCGKTRKLVEVERNGKPFGEAESGSHPWMALVVLTTRPQSILCYATIVHPRAAVTAGDCVYGRTSPKEVILLAGLWNLNDRSRIQNRVVTVQLHPQYRPKVLAHDLALLHWKTPLKLNANIQPTCLGGASETTDCKFFGWGGFDQGIHTRSRWQRATVLSAQECSSRFAKAVSMPQDAFCATVQSLGTVTGIGGPLICNTNGRKTSAGVAVWRDNALVLIPAHEWIVRALQDLNIQ